MGATFHSWIIHEWTNKQTKVKHSLDEDNSYLLSLELLKFTYYSLTQLVNIIRRPAKFHNILRISQTLPRG